MLCTTSFWKLFSHSNHPYWASLSGSSAGVPLATAHKAYLLIITCLLTPFLPGFLHIFSSQPPLLLKERKKAEQAVKRAIILKTPQQGRELSSKLVQAFAPLPLSRHRAPPIVPPSPAFTGHCKACWLCYAQLPLDILPMFLGHYSCMSPHRTSWECQSTNAPFSD
jgi:hypothetical protein